MSTTPCPYCADSVRRAWASVGCHLRSFPSPPPRPVGLATWPAHRQSGLVRTPKRRCSLMALATLCGATPALGPPSLF
eukprot:scaffold37720_cov67-Phaeocystis_antarctica.AAC.19